MTLIAVITTAIQTSLGGNDNDIYYVYHFVLPTFTTFKSKRLKLGELTFVISCFVL